MTVLSLQPVTDETALKIALIAMAVKSGGNSLCVAALEFLMTLRYQVFKFNKVPHDSVRGLYDQFVAVCQAVEDDTVKAQSRLQLILNFPELNPKFTPIA